MSDIKELFKNAGINLEDFAPTPESLNIAGGLIVPGYYDKPVKALSEWQKQRLGKITGSQFHRVKRGPNGKGWSDGAETYLSELVYEWITGKEHGDFSGSKETEWGNQHESDAIALYSFKSGQKVKRGEFFPLIGEGFHGLVGCTPDGVGDYGLEIKCPYNPSSHLYTLRTGKIPARYKDQVFGHMLCTGRNRCDFVSYDPRLPEKFKCVLIEVERSSWAIQELTERLYEFEEYLIKTLDELEIDWRV